MFTAGECFLEGAIGDLLSDYKKRGLLGCYFKDFDYKIGLNVFEFFKIFWEFDVRKFDDFDGDKDVGFVLSTLPHRVVVGGKVRFFSLESILFKDFLVLLFH